MVALAVAGTLAAVGLPSNRTAAEDTGPRVTQPPEPPSGAADPSASGVEDRRTIGRLPANIGRAFVGVFDKDNAVPIELGAVATALVITEDNSIITQLGGPNDFSRTAQTAGGGLYASLAVAGMFASGRFAHGERYRAMTYDMAVAALVNGAYTAAMKGVFRRERPDGSNKSSFPSGHASNAFTLAAVAERHYGWKVGVPAYTVAGLIGISRLQQNKHYPTDVVAGATLGYIVGRTVARVNGGPVGPARRTTWNVSPIGARGSRGALLTVAF